MLNQMMDLLTSAAALAERWVVRMEPHHWALAAAVVLLVGVLCMRGLAGKTSP